METVLEERRKETADKVAEFRVACRVVFCCCFTLSHPGERDSVNTTAVDEIRRRFFPRSSYSGLLSFHVLSCWYRNSALCASRLCCF